MTVRRKNSFLRSRRHLYADLRTALRAIFCEERKSALFGGFSKPQNVIVSSPWSLTTCANTVQSVPCFCYKIVWKYLVLEISIGGHLGNLNNVACLISITKWNAFQILAKILKILLTTVSCIFSSSFFLVIELLFDGKKSYADIFAQTTKKAFKVKTYSWI